MRQCQKEKSWTRRMMVCPQAHTFYLASVYFPSEPNSALVGERCGWFLAFPLLISSSDIHTPTFSLSVSYSTLLTISLLLFHCSRRETAEAIWESHYNQFKNQVWLTDWIPCWEASFTYKRIMEMFIVLFKGRVMTERQLVKKLPINFKRIILLLLFFPCKKSKHIF